MRRVRLPRVTSSYASDALAARDVRSRCSACSSSSLALVCRVRRAAPGRVVRPAAGLHRGRLGAGAYPDLEALIPTSYEGRAPDTLDSGRNCTPKPRRACATAGIDEVRFAGGTWGFGGERAAALAVFRRPGPDGRRDGRLLRHERQRGEPDHGHRRVHADPRGPPGHRIDTMTGERTADRRRLAGRRRRTS